MEFHWWYSEGDWAANASGTFVVQRLLSASPGFAKAETRGFPVVSRLEAVRGDITREAVDAIVNAANPALGRGGGVCGAIFAAAGPGLDEACAALGGCATGDAKATPGFALPARWIIHAVGPVWQGGTHGEPEQLAAAYERCLAVADELGARSMAFPAISTGIYGYPLEEATDIAVATVTDTPTAVERVRFVCFDDRTLAAYQQRLP
jgi:O-acetyl-ADP-ribose deacetylase (regulator of RNase III)